MDEPLHAAAPGMLIWALTCLVASLAAACSPGPLVLVAARPVMSSQRALLAHERARPPDAWFASDYFGEEHAASDAALAIWPAETEVQAF